MSEFFFASRVAKKSEILTIAREAFDDVPDEAIELRLQKYPEIAIAADDEGIGGFVFPTPHACGRNRMVGLRFLTVGDRCRNRKLTTLLTGVVLVRAYRKYLVERLRPGGPKNIYVIARVCNPKAYYTLTKGNPGVSPELGAEEPRARVLERHELYAWMEQGLGLSQFDPKTGIVVDGAVGAGIVPRNVSVGSKDQEDWIYEINNNLALTYATMGKLDSSKQYYSIANDHYNSVYDKKFWKLYQINQIYNNDELAMAYLDSSYNNLLERSKRYTNKQERQIYLN